MLVLPEELSGSCVELGTEEVVDIDLGDPEVEKAAILIQSGFKSFKKKKQTSEIILEPQVAAKVSAGSDTMTLIPASLSISSL